MTFWINLILTSKSGEREHADLVGDVVPRAGRLQLFQTLAQPVAHEDHPIGHGFNVALPLGVQFGVVEHRADDAAAVVRRIRIVGAYQQRYLRPDGAHHSRRLGDDRQISHSFVCKKINQVLMTFLVFPCFETLNLIIN